MRRRLDSTYLDSIQNNSGLSQRFLPASMLGWGCSNAARAVGRLVVIAGAAGPKREERRARREAARVHRAARRRDRVAAHGAGAAAGHTGDWIFERQVAGGCVWPRCCCRTSGRPIARSRCAPITSMAIAVDSSTIRAMIVTVARSFERSAAKPDRVHGVAEG
jgi:hypothetical protein